MWAPTVAAARSAGPAGVGPVPCSTSRARAAAIATGPSGVCFRPRSYAHTVTASGRVRRSRTRRPPASAPRPRPAAVSPPAMPSAAPALIRPDGTGRSGRSRASSSRSAQSLRAMPAQYRLTEEAARSRVRPPAGRPALSAPASTSPGTVSAAGARTSSATAVACCRTATERGRYPVSYRGRDGTEVVPRAVRNAVAVARAASRHAVRVSWAPRVRSRRVRRREPARRGVGAPEAGGGAVAVVIAPPRTGARARRTWPPIRSGPRTAGSGCAPRRPPGP